MTNPGVVRYQLAQVEKLFANRANGVVFDVFGLTNVSGRCGVYDHGVCKPLGYPPIGQDNARIDGDALNWLRTITEAIPRFPGKTIGLNLNIQDAGSRLLEIAPYVDMIFDEAGFILRPSESLR